MDRDGYRIITMLLCAVLMAYSRLFGKVCIISYIPFLFINSSISNILSCFSFLISLLVKSILIRIKKSLKFGLIWAILFMVSISTNLFSFAGYNISHESGSSTSSFIIQMPNEFVNLYNSCMNSLSDSISAGVGNFPSPYFE